MNCPNCGKELEVKEKKVIGMICYGSNLHHLKLKEE